MTQKDDGFEYSARLSYSDINQAKTYEEVRFSGIVGRYRRRREESAIKAFVSSIPSDSSVLDIPCGTGRWWPLLGTRAATIVAMDVSPGMLQFARKRAVEFHLPVSVLEGNAEAIPLPDNAVDVVFSHALTKHLPVPVQYRVLRELARVSRGVVVCSFGIFSHLTYEIWRRRGLEESYPVFPEELQWMAMEAGLRIIERRPCTTPAGVEYSVLFGPSA